MKLLGSRFSERWKFWGNPVGKFREMETRKWDNVLVCGFFTLSWVFSLFFPNIYAYFQEFSLLQLHNNNILWDLKEGPNSPQTLIMWEKNNCSYQPNKSQRVANNSSVRSICAENTSTEILSQDFCENQVLLSLVLHVEPWISMNLISQSPHGARGVFLPILQIISQGRDG